MLSSALAAGAGGMAAEATGATAAGAGASADLLATPGATGAGATTEAGVDGATSAEANGFWYSDSAFSTCTAEGW